MECGKLPGKRNWCKLPLLEQVTTSNVKMGKFFRIRFHCRLPELFCIFPLVETVPTGRKLWVGGSYYLGLVGEPNPYEYGNGRHFLGTTIFLTNIHEDAE